MATTVCARATTVTTIHDCKLLARANGQLRGSGLEAVPLVVALDIVRRQTIRIHGMRHYLYAMLGRAARLPIQDCELLDANGDVLPVDPMVQNRAGQMPVADYIESQYSVDTMPVAVRYQQGEKEQAVLAL
jgi:hypothetical protein